MSIISDVTSHDHIMIRAIVLNKINDFQIIDIGGKDKFKHDLPLLKNTEGFSEVHTLGFIRDAETNQL